MIRSRVAYRGRVRSAIGGLLALALAPTVVHAHHVPGHSGSEGVRNFNSLGGGTGQALTRVALLSEVSRNSTSQTPGTLYNTSLLGEYSPHPWFSFGLQVPLLVIDPAPAPEPEEAADPSTTAGLGDLRVLARLTPHADKLVHRVPTFVFAASFPTRTAAYPFSDPGPIWSISPTFIYSRTYARVFWQAMSVATIEHRRAGTALDTSAGGQVGYRWFDNRLAPAIGMIGDLRIATFCARIGSPGEDWCPKAARLQDNSTLRTEGRLTENDRPIGAVRLAGMVSLSYAFSSWGLLAASVQLPLLAKRDFDIAGSVSIQARF